MKRTALALILILASLLFLIGVVSSFQMTHAISDTFQLDSGWYFENSVELQKNDRVEGNFIVSDLLPYKPVWTFPWQDSGAHTHWVAVEVFDPEYQHILNYTKVSGDITYFFNFTAINSGRYVIRSYSSDENFPPEAKIPQITINYNVVEATQTRINVLSPLNQTYYESSLSLNFTTNKPLSWVGYSLDGKDNVTIDSNTTLTGLSNGLHKITVYANNTYGNLVGPETVFFTVEPFPMISVAVSVVVVVVVMVGVVVLVYFKKRKH